MAAPRQRIGPRSRYWVIVLLVRAATSQPKKVVPYLGVVSMQYGWNFEGKGGLCCCDVFGRLTYNTATMSVLMS
jgi:hypothetical protein